MIDVVDWSIEFEIVDGDYKQMIDWLVNNIEEVRDRHTAGEYFGKPKPYHFSSISQFARFRGFTDKWYLEIQGNQQRKIVRFHQTVPHRKIVEFALKYTCQAK
jgi:hypothetical protein